MTRPADGDALARHDWGDSPLGRVAEWPHQLRFLADLLLRSEQPMFLLWGSERLFVYNDAYQALWGDRSADSLGFPVQKVARESWDQLGPLVRRVFDGDSFVERNFPLPDPLDGRMRYFDLSYTPVRGYDAPDGPVVAALCITTDVSQQYLAVERTRQEREILALTVDNVTEGVALTERDLSLVLWNAPFLAHFGYGTEEVRYGMNAAELIRRSAVAGDLGPGDPREIAEGLSRSIMGHDGGALEVQRLNGTVLMLRRRRVSGGRHLLVSRDVTDERLAARLKDELVSTVSHELRTPLAAISGALGIVAAGPAGELSEKATKLIGIAQRNSERLIALVNDLLDANKLQSGKVEFRWERIDLNELVLAAVDQNQPYGAAAGVVVEAQIPPAPVSVRADRNRLLQVLTNLLSNAVKFSPAGETVVARVTINTPSATITVIDRGMGVPEQFRGRLFERFSQHDGSASRVQQGTGLGLAISLSIVEQLGGSLRFEPTHPQGATFHVELPVLDD